MMHPAVLERVHDLAAQDLERRRRELERRRREEDEARRCEARGAVEHDLSYWLHRIEKAISAASWDVTNASLHPRRSDAHYIAALAEILGPLFVVRLCQRGLPPHKCVEVVLADA